MDFFICIGFCFCVIIAFTVCIALEVKRAKKRDGETGIAAANKFESEQSLKHQLLMLK